MSRSRSNQDEEPGQDSFLDIVANLVGIMIILVIVIGVRAKGEMQQAAPKLQIPAPKAPDVEGAAKAVRAVQLNLTQTRGQLAKQDREVKYRQIERNKLLTLISALENELKSRRDSLDDAGKELFDRRQEVAAAQAELHKLSQQVNVLEQEEERVEVIQHLPTPMAKTVFGREVHFRLAEGLLTYVPWDEMVERLKEDARENVWKLKNAPSVTETLGPIRNFMMKYTLVNNSYTVETRVGDAMQNRVDLESFELFPIEEVGESLAVALGADSQFNAVLASYEPSRTTITVWVYPDSFSEYRELQKALYDRGYLSAARPMPEGVNIGGSPKGTRTAAQ